MMLLLSFGHVQMVEEEFPEHDAQREEDGVIGGNFRFTPAVFIFLKKT